MKLVPQEPVQDRAAEVVDKPGPWIDAEFPEEIP